VTYLRNNRDGPELQVQVLELGLGGEGSALGGEVYRGVAIQDKLEREDDKVKHRPAIVNKAAISPGTSNTAARAITVQRP